MKAITWTFQRLSVKRIGVPRESIGRSQNEALHGVLCLGQSERRPTHYAPSSALQRPRWQRPTERQTPPGMHLRHEASGFVLSRVRRTCAFKGGVRSALRPDSQADLVERFGRGVGPEYPGIPVLRGRSDDLGHGGPALSSSRSDQCGLCTARPWRPRRLELAKDGFSVTNAGATANQHSKKRLREEPF